MPKSGQSGERDNATGKLGQAWLGVGPDPCANANEEHQINRRRNGKTYTCRQTGSRRLHGYSCGSAQARCRRISTERHFCAYKIKQNQKESAAPFFLRAPPRQIFIHTNWRTPTFGSKLSTRKFCGACGFRFTSPRKDVFQRETVEPASSAASGVSF